MCEIKFGCIIFTFIHVHVHVAEAVTWEVMKCFKWLQTDLRHFETLTQTFIFVCAFYRLKVIPITQIQRKAVLLEGYKGKCFVAKLPNRYEKD